MARIHPRYAEYSLAVAEELDKAGFVLLADALEDVSLDADWEREDVPDLHRYERAAVPGALREAIAEYVKSLEESLELSWSSFRRFSRGDYTLQHDEQPPAGLHTVLVLTDADWEQSWRGDITFVPPAGQPLIIPVADKSLALIRSEEDWRFFVKRLTHYAEDSFCLLHLVFAKNS